MTNPTPGPTTATPAHVLERMATALDFPAALAPVVQATAQTLTAISDTVNRTVLPAVLRAAHPDPTDWVLSHDVDDLLDAERTGGR